MNLTKSFVKYASQNIMGMIGVSFYIIIDTFFIAKAAGADGITVLNLAIPLFNVMYAFGSMLGLGAGTRFAIYRARGDEEADKYLFNSLAFGMIIGLIFTFCGLLLPEKILTLMGGTPDIVDLGADYFRFFLMGGPFFIINYVVASYVRNDNDPALAMLGTIGGSVFNVIFDYVFMFVMDMGLAGAALASLGSPIVSILVCSIHFFKKKNTVKLVNTGLSFKRFVNTCQVGVTGFVGEMSAAVTTTIFNFLVLKLVGNIGVAAFGVVTNISIIVMAVFNGLAQGTQPLASECYGRADFTSLRKLVKLGIGTAYGLAALIYGSVFLLADEFTALFNSEGNAELASYAVPGIKLYFVAFFFASINIYCAGIYGATNRPKMAFIISAMRGFVLIIICSICMAKIWGIDGVWMSFTASELITFVFVIFNMKKLWVQTS